LVDSTVQKGHSRVQQEVMVKREVDCMYFKSTGISQTANR